MKVPFSPDIQRRTIPPGNRQREEDPMTIRRWSGVAVLAALAVISYACGTEKTVGSRFVKSELISATRGGSIGVTQAEEPALAGTTLAVPPSALLVDSRLTLELGLTDLSSTPRGPVAIWGPSGTTFSPEAKLTMPIVLQSADEASLLEIVVEEENGTRFVIPNEQLTIDTTAHLVTFSVKGFTRFQPGTAQRDGGAGGGTAGAAGGTANTAGGSASAGGGAALSCRSDADCPANQQCALRVPAQPGSCVNRPQTGGGTAGTGGGTSGTGGGNTVRQCGNVSQCLAGEQCVIRTPGTVGYCAPGNPQGGGSAGTGGGSVFGGGNAGGAGAGGSGAGGSGAGGGGALSQPCRQASDCAPTQQCVNNVCV